MPQGKKLNRAEEAILFGRSNDTFRKHFNHRRFKSNFGKAFSTTCIINGKHLTSVEEKELIKETVKSNA